MPGQPKIFLLRVHGARINAIEALAGKDDRPSITSRLDEPIKSHPNNRRAVTPEVEIGCASRLAVVRLYSSCELQTAFKNKP